MALQMHTNDRIPLFLAHVGERPIAQNPRIVDENIELAEIFNGARDHVPSLRPVGHIVAACQRVLSECTDLVDNMVGRGRIPASPVEIAAHVVDQDPGAMPRQGDGMGAAKPAACTRHDRDPALEIRRPRVSFRVCLDAGSYRVGRGNVFLGHPDEPPLTPAARYFRYPG